MDDEDDEIICIFYEGVLMSIKEYEKRTGLKVIVVEEESDVAQSDPDV